MIRRFFLDGNSSTICILAYYQHEESYTLQQFDHTIFEGIIVIFHFEYFFKKFVDVNPPTFLIGNPQNFVCLIIIICTGADPGGGMPPLKLEKI